MGPPVYDDGLVRYQWEKRPLVQCPRVGKGENREVEVGVGGWVGGGTPS